MKLFISSLLCGLLAVVIALSTVGGLLAAPAVAAPADVAPAVTALTDAPSTAVAPVMLEQATAAPTAVVDSASTPNFHPDSEAITTSPAGGQQVAVPFTLVYLPVKNWTEITAQRYPNLYRVVEGAAIGNLVSDNSNIFEELTANNNINLYNLEGLSARDADGEIAKLLPDKLAQGVFVLVCSPSFVRQEACPSLTPVLVSEAGFSGYLTSSTTKRTGLISASDLLYFEKQLNSVEEAVVTTPSQAVTKTVFDLTGLQSGQLLKDKLAFLQHNIAICEGIAATVAPMNLLFLALFILMAAFSLVLLFFEIDVSPRYLSILVPINRGLMLVTLSFPIACFLMFLTPPAFYGFADSGAGLVVLCLLWTAVLVMASLLIGSLSKWIYSLLFLFIITFATLTIDQLLGGPLTLTGFLNYSVRDGVRYFGLGNEAAALLFGSWITFSGVVVNRFGSAKLMPIFKRWLFLVISAVIIIICALPNIGASFGVLVWGVMGILIAWWLFSGRPINLPFLLITIALSLALAVGTLIVDINFNPYSHLWNLRTYMSDPIMLVSSLVGGLGAYSVATLLYSPALTVVFIIVVLWLVILAIIRPGTYREFWARNLGFRAVYAAGLVVMLIMCLVEDSGIYMPSLYVVYLLSGFIWIICDMHTWRVRATAQSGEHITLRDLLRIAIEKETYADLGQGAVALEKDEPNPHQNEKNNDG